MAIEIVDLPIKNGDFPYFLYVYQRVCGEFSLQSIDIHNDPDLRHGIHGTPDLTQEICP